MSVSEKGNSRDTLWLNFLPTYEKSRRKNFAQKKHKLWDCPELQELPRQSLSLTSRNTLPAENNSATANLQIN
jgi:hypothetical protein